MNLIAFSLLGREIYWSALVIMLGVLLSFALTLRLWRQRGGELSPVLSLFVLGFAFSVLFARLLHWYFNAESYASLSSAMTDFSNGSFCLQGMLLGVWLAAWLTKLTRLTDSTGKLLDAAAPGVCLLIAFIRLSAFFNTTCRSKILITNPRLQFLPIASGMTDAAGNTVYRMATFAIEFLLMLGVTLIVWAMFRRMRRRMRPPCSDTGNVARLATVIYGAVEIVMDSTRYDSPLMHFRLISYLNQYSAFISLAQIFAAATVLGILIYYSRCAIKARGFLWFLPLDWVLFGVCAFCIGKLGEYNVQRYATYGRCYAIMSVSCAVMVLTILIPWYACRRKRRRRAR